MKSKYEQWCTTIKPISTIRKITSHLKSLTIKKDETYDVGYQDLGL
jgi:hypothetical protein